MVNWLYLDYRCRCHHCTGMFHIHSMWMSAADDHDYSNQRFVLSVANDNVDGADCKLVYIDFGFFFGWFYNNQLEFCGSNFAICFYFCLIYFLMQSYFLLLHAQFSMWHTIIIIKQFFWKKWYKTPNVNVYVVMSVRCKNMWKYYNHKKKENEKKWTLIANIKKVVLYDY